jgi:hypothetical protein
MVVPASLEETNVRVDQTSGPLLYKIRDVFHLQAAGPLLYKIDRARIDIFTKYIVVVRFCR